VYDLPNRQKLSVAVGLHSQIQPTHAYFYRFRSRSDSRQPVSDYNRNLGLTKSWHYVAAYDRLMGRNMKPITSGCSTYR